MPTFVYILGIAILTVIAVLVEAASEFVKGAAIGLYLMAPFLIPVLLTRSVP